MDATCTAPKTCSVCGATEGEALGHYWMETPVGTTGKKTNNCLRCGQIEGFSEVDGIVWSFDNGVLTLSGDGPMPDYPGYAYAPWNIIDITRATVSSIVIEDGLTTIGACAFCNFIDLKNVEIPNSVTTIKESAFYNSIGFETITIPDSVTAIESRAFQKCTGLKEITIPAGVTEIGDGIIAGAQWLESVKVAEGNSSFVAVDNVIFTADMTRLVAFSGQRVEEYTVPDGVTTIGGGAFMSGWVENVTVPEGVTTIESKAFYDCGIESVTLPASLTAIGEAVFEECLSLTDIYFAGTAEQWADISANASVPENVTVHYGA